MIFKYYAWTSYGIGSVYNFEGLCIHFLITFAYLGSFFFILSGFPLRWIVYTVLKILRLHKFARKVNIALI